MKKSTMIDGVLFDMDGVLTDSEPLWHLAEIEIFTQAGVPMTQADCLRLAGLRIDDLVAQRFLESPWVGMSQSEVVQRIDDAVEKLILERSKPLPGAKEAIDFFKDQGFPVGLASSSSFRLIASTLKAIGLDQEFQVVHSAEREILGKPHPAVYLEACRQLGTNPVRTLAIEDSLNGVIAAKAARMRVFAMPAPHERTDPRFAVADAQIANLGELPTTFSHWISGS